MPSSRRRALDIVVPILLVAAAGFLGYQVGQERSAGGGGPLIGIASVSGGDYVGAVREAGGIPVVLPDAGGNEASIEGYLESLDGLLLPGGADIPPSEYGEDPHPTVRELDEDRYRFERALSRAWLERTDKPLLGICLGNQWLNVAGGGSLVQDIPSEYGVDHREGHSISIEPDSRLAGILGATELEVNSNHHQAVKKVGEGLRVVARCPDGVVEATEVAGGDRFVVGVQWHPERMIAEDERQAGLLEAFVEAARTGAVAR